MRKRLNRSVRRTKNLFTLGLIKTSEWEWKKFKLSQLIHKLMKRLPSHSSMDSDSWMKDYMKSG